MPAAVHRLGGEEPAVRSGRTAALPCAATQDLGGEAELTYAPAGSLAELRFPL